MAVDTTIQVVMPQMGDSVSEGTVLEWRKTEGDSVAADETIVEISTDKVDAEVPAPVAGTIAKIHVAEGDTVTVGALLAEIAQTNGAAANAAVAPPDSAPPAPPLPTPAPATQGSANGSAADHTGTKASPIARRAAGELEVDLAALSGSGPGGRITKADVLDAAAHPLPAEPVAAKRRPPATTAPRASSLRGGAAMLAAYMDESRSIPTATSFRTITVGTLDARRRQLKEAGFKVSFTHLIAFAIARAATELSVMATHFAQIDGVPHRVDDGAVNLGLAVDVPKKDGSHTLLVPVLRDAGRQPFDEFLRSYDGLVEQARANQLTADDLAGANITLTNPGGLGTSASVPRLMVGQGTIVATGQIGYPPGLAEIGEQIGAEKVLTLTSTYDHRVIQGAESGRFLARISALLAGEDDFYGAVFAALGLTLHELAPRPLPAPAALTARPSDELLAGVAAAGSLVRAHRLHGHLAARLDPLGSEPVGDPALDPRPLGLTEQLMAQIPASLLRVHVPGATLAEVYPHLRETYCGTIAYEIEHIASHRQRGWLREKIEGGAFRAPLSVDEQRALLTRLIEVDALERFMHKAYLGQHQFSIEGVDMAVPMLDEMIQLAAADGAEEVVIGMAHRGRLNVLAHSLERSYESIFAEFEGASTLEVVTTIPQGGTGDVKYHHGAEGSYRVRSGETVHVNLESNPSHLEYVSPVVMGATRAAQTTHQGRHMRQDVRGAVAIVIHGDAAFPGQGIVAETLNLQTLDGYQVGGTLHLITNNQIGFTTDPDDGRSTQWASDLAKGYDVPIIHVNADDVEACIAAVRLAFAFREEFGHDVLIDLIGYRRYGHNEADEPAYTQPEIYAQIKTKPRVSELWADTLVQRGVVTRADVDQQLQAVWDGMTAAHQELKAKIEQARNGGIHEHPITEYQIDRTPTPDIPTAVPLAVLAELNEDLLRVGESFNVHPKLVRQLERRRDVFGAGANVDWAHAEALAFASLLREGHAIRLTGQDSERGTFSQRHLVLHDAKNGQTLCPMQHIVSATAPFELHNSPLSECGCLGFEYGYSQESPDTLVLWEAQYGDFVNSADVIIDQFIASGLAKWGVTSKLTMLLPHGYEGSGPEHSSGRLERFLQLAAEGNLRVANLTTPAQYFHLLRRQAMLVKQRPLVVMTPKSLLRLPQATSGLGELTDGQFHSVLAEPGVDSSKVTRLVLCTGKIYYDLVGHSSRAAAEQIAIGRMELLYPFPERQLRELLASYPDLREVVWTQEEPRNMGARAYMSQRLRQMMRLEGIEFAYIGRPERASPGEGYPAAHAQEQARIVTTALDITIPVSQYPAKTPGER
ncbi:MAG: multifunctional oxoglutarate decarboxylase/oxoglutarate dehydrogenase thiamine pyrophosphate-binding subunit/dihydrolipoyllysine-residue succinyltransferase subunit [Solirubrobacteraceae bacterium]